MKKNLITGLKALLLLFICLPSSYGQHTTINQDVNFSTTNQGWYKSGIPSYGRKEYLLGNARTFTSFELGDDDFLALSAKMGFDFDLYYDVLSMPDGRVDVNVPIDISYTYPTDRTYGCDEEIPILLSFTMRPGYSITSSPPQFKMNLGLRAKAGVWTAVESFFGDATIVNYGVNGFNDATSDNYQEKMRGGETPFFGFDTNDGVYLPFRQGLPYTIPNDVSQVTNLEGTISHPFSIDPVDQVYGRAIQETGGNQFVNLDFDPSQFLGELIGVPLSATGSNNFGSAGYTIFEAPFNITSNLTHDLTFIPTFYVKMKLDRVYDYRVRDNNGNILQTGTDDEVDIEASQTLLLKVPDDNQPITIVPKYSLDNEFTTHIRYDAGLDVNIRALSAFAQSNSVEICDPTGIIDFFGFEEYSCYTFGPFGQSFGPVYEENFNLYDFSYDFYPPTTRKLGGFQEITGSPFTLRPDNIPPVLNTKNITVYIPDAGGPVNIIPQDVVQSASDANGGTLRYLNVTPNSFECANLGTNTVEVQIDDSRCNETTKTAVVTVVDRTKPTLVCKPHTVYLDDFGATGIVTSDVLGSAWDNCGTINQVSVLPNTFACTNLGNNTVTLTVNDGHNNTSTCNSIVTVVDNKPPVLVCKPKFVYLDDLGQGSIVTSDVLESSYDNCGVVNVVSVLPNSFNCSVLGENTVTVSTNDGHGNNMTCNAVVTVLDKIIPTVECKFRHEVMLNAAGNASIVTADVFVKGADNCGVVNQESVYPNTFNCNNLGANLVTLTVNDSHGNTNTCTTTVGVFDQIKPTMICRNVTLNLDNNGQATLNTSQVNNGSFDNCVIPIMTLSQTSFSCANLGTNLVILSAEDQSFNRNTCSATITLRDQQAPTALCKNITANLGVNGTLVASPEIVSNGSRDNCSFSLALTPNNFNCSNLGPNTVQLKATDVSGNTATCTAIITVRDQTGPTALCKNPTIYLNDSGQGTLTLADVNNGSWDACGISTTTLSKTDFNCSHITGTQSVTMTLKDVNNNISTCLSTVTVRETMAPTAVCQNTTVALGQNGVVTVYPENLALDSYDNCSVYSYFPVAKVYTSANLGANNLTITVKDFSNNAATCVSVVTVIPYSSSRQTDERNQVEEVVETAAGFDFKLYPNPASEEVTTAFEMPWSEPFTLRLFDRTGRLVFQHKGVAEQGENVVSVKLGSVLPGVYVLDFQSETLNARKKLVVKQ